MKTRTRRQKEVLDYITRYIDSHGYEPSYQMIARYLGVSSKAGIAKHIKALEEQGHLQRRRENGSFSIELNGTKNGDASRGLIEWLEATGADGEREEWETEPFVLPAFMIGGVEPAQLCAFRVTDDAMSGKNICEGDVVLVERRPYVRDGGLVVATVKRKETLLRSYYRVGADIELRSADDSFETLRLNADKIEVHGVFRSLLRLPK